MVVLGIITQETGDAKRVRPRKGVFRKFMEEPKAVAPLYFSGYFKKAGNPGIPGPRLKNQSRTA
jgi:hypothetical protein